MILIDRVYIRGYLKKYLASYHPVDPFMLTEKNRFGTLLISNLRFKTKAEKEILERPNIHKHYLNAILEIGIPEHYWVGYGPVITSIGQHRFNNQLLDEFQDRLVEFVLPGLKRKGDLNMMLLTFREKFDIIEDELSLKTLQKIWEREKYRASRCKSA